VTNNHAYHHSVSVVRPQHVLQWTQDGDPTLLWFLEAVTKWLGECATLRPLCLACDHEFNDRVAPPLTFVCAAVNLGKDGRPRQVILTGVCGKCAAKSDHELMAVGLAGLRERWPLLFGGAVHDVSEDGSDGVN
jgi:hypothetical protein